MPDTYTQIYIHVVFAVRGRSSLICASWENQLHKYITGIVQNKGQKMLAINSMPDHIHFFIGMKPTCCLSDLVREVKKSSNEYILKNKFCPLKFQWQSGFGAFSYGHSQLNNVIAYIMSQKEHHKKKSFKEEYLRLLEKFQTEYKKEHLFEWID